MANNQFTHSAKNLVIRADADSQMGTGHIMRCIALGQAWDGRVTFVTTCQNMDLIHKIRQENFNVEFIKNPLSLEYCHGIESWIVIDGYHFTETYQRQVKQSGNPVLVIDDFAKMKHYTADIILNQNLNAKDLDYKYEGYTQLLSGTNYTLLRKEFLGKKGRSNATIKNVIVTMGGSDPENYTQKIFTSLQYLGYGFNIGLIIGASNDNFKTLPLNVNLVRNPDNFVELLTKADLIISSAGVTMWECFYIGIPTIIVPITPLQKDLVKYVNNYTKVCSKFSTKSFADLVSSYSNDFYERTTLSNQAQTLIDGKGSQRVIDIMKSYEQEM